MGLLKALGSTECRIFQFEPSQRCQAILRSLNLPQTTLIEAAVSDKPGIATLHDPQEGPSMIASLHPRREANFRRYKFIERTVKIVTIDEVIAEFEIEAVDFMKLDIEGHELAALRGAKDSLESKRIKALAFEFGCGNMNSRTYFYDLWDFLRPYGYTIKRICPGGVLLPIEEYSQELEHFRGVSNYLALLE